MEQITIKLPKARNLAEQLNLLGEQLREWLATVPELYINEYGETDRSLNDVLFCPNYKDIRWDDPIYEILRAEDRCQHKIADKTIIDRYQRKKREENPVDIPKHAFCNNEKYCIVRSTRKQPGAYHIATKDPLEVLCAAPIANPQVLGLFDKHNFCRRCYGIWRRGGVKLADVKK